MTWFPSGDFPPPIPHAPPWTCNCACATCMAGSCCQFNRQPTYVTTTTAPVLDGCPHKYEVHPTYPDLLFCSHCGDTKVIALPE
jgi:hypothetical protein